LHLNGILHDAILMSVPTSWCLLGQ